MTFRDNKLLLSYRSPHLRGFSSDAQEKASNGRVSWTVVRESFVGFAYNTNLLAAAEVPKDFDGLLKPELRDRMAMPGDETGARTIGAMIKIKGDGFVRKLKQQNIRLHMIAGSALTQLLATGEVPASPTQFFSATNVAIKAGAPLAWVAPEIVVSSAAGAAIYANAQHPHAAALFIDFLLSPEGQKLYEDLYFGSPRKDYGFKRWYPERGFTVAQYEQASEQWHKLLLEVTRK
jgi:iron(III) transport system substrate-binding protein